MPANSTSSGPRSLSYPLSAPSVQYWALAAAVFAVQFFLVGRAFPWSELGSGVPLFHIDGAYHWYCMKLGVNLAATGNIVGYDPFFAAGHANGIHYNFSARMPTLLAILSTPGVDEIRIYKAYAFTSAVVAPIAVVAAAAALRLAPMEAFIAALLGIAMWWVSYLHWYYTAGMVGFVTVCYLAVLFVALIIRYLQEGGRPWVPFFLGMLGAFGFFWHSLFPVPVAFAIVAYLAIHRTRLNWPRTVWTLAIIAAISLLPNLFWLYATVRYTDPSPPNDMQMVVDASRLGRELLGLLRQDASGSKAYPVLFLAALWACTRREPERDKRRLWQALLLGAIALELLAYLGGAIRGVGEIQPNRFAPAGYLLLCIPAARGLALIGRTVLDAAAGKWRPFAGALLAAVVLLSAVLTWELWREVTPGPQGRYGAPPPQVTPLGDNSVWIIDWLKRRTSPDARVLFETSFARIHDHAHMAGFYAYASQREFIGGPYPRMHYASAWDGFLFRTPTSDMSSDRMTEYLSLYNIGAIIVHSDAAKRFFDALPGVRLDAEHGKLRAYLVESEHSYVLKGTGRVVERGHNRLLIADIAGPELVLKYHYVPGMKTDPPTSIEGVRLMDDPTPFVRILNPPPRLRIYMP